MASRTSGMLLSETYQGTRRGRSRSGDMGWEMFPEKTEITDIYEEPEAVDEDRRTSLKDYSPDRNALFAEEETRRDTHARDFLQLRNFGSRSSVQPWLSQGDSQIDIQFHDHDPRGWSTETPWQEYRRLAYANRKRTDFKDDGDYTETSGAVHPNTMYRDIRSAQNWFKARFKNFDTSLEGRHNGGVGVYDHTSGVFKSQSEDTTIKDDGMDATFEDPEIRQRTTMRLSNAVHLGSKALRVNTTTDHRVPVAAYGKLYGQRGLQNHESQLRLIEDDTPRSRINTLTTSPRNLAKLMSQYVHDADYANGNFGDGRKLTNAAVARKKAQNPDQEKGLKEGLANNENTVNNRSQKVTADILALFGITEHEVKWAKSLENTNPKHAQLTLANMVELVEMVHKLPLGERIKVRDELIMKHSGKVVKGDLRHIQQESEVVINPKLLRQIQQDVRGWAPLPEDPTGALREIDADRKVREPTAIYVRKTASRDSEDVVLAGHNVTTQERAFKYLGSVEAKDYSQMHQTAVQLQKNRQNAANSHVGVDTSGGDRYNGKVVRPKQGEIARNMRSAVDDQDHLDMGAGKIRHARTAPHAVATASSMSRHTASDYVSADQTMELSGAPRRKSPWNLNHKQKNNVAFVARDGYIDT